MGPYGHNHNLILQLKAKAKYYVFSKVRKHFFLGKLHGVTKNISRAHQYKLEAALTVIEDDATAKELMLVPVKLPKFLR